jgi:hypothetical protein
MNLRKQIQKEISRILSENDNLPWGAEFISDAPYNQSDAVIRKGQEPRETKYMPVWYGYNSGVAILKDSSGKLYAFDYETVDDEDFEPYANREVVGYDEDQYPEYSDVELDGDVLAAYANDNLDKLSTGTGLSDYQNDVDIVLIDQELKEYLLNFATKYVKRGKDELIKNLSDFSPSMNEYGALDETALSEAKMPNESFVKVFFEYEFPSNEKRKELMDITRSHFGEALGKSREEQYWSTYIPKLELEDFLSDAMEFNPMPTEMEIQANRFKPLTKGLQDGDIISFYDYTISENDPPRKEGYLKPGFIQRNRSLLKWNDGGKEAWIDNSMIDKYYFYHGDVSDIKDHPSGRKLDSDYVKIFFDDAMLNNMNFDQEDELRKIITNHKGQLRYVFGKDRASGGQRYTLVPQDLADDFIQAAYDFGAQYAETERNIRLEDKALNEIRKIVRGVINKVVK